MIFLSIFFKLILGQLFVAAIVILVLKAVLDNSLLDAAVKQFELLSPRVESAMIQEVVVTSRKPLPATMVRRVGQVVKRNWGEAPRVIYKIDKLMMGGVVIQFSGYVINYSLKDRLRQAFGK